MGAVFIMLSSTKSFFSPTTEQSHGLAALGVLLLLAVSALSLLAAPLVMPESYSWLSNTTSESGAQGVAGAWLARLGFLTFGLAVLLLTASLRSVWARGANWLHAAFGVFMIATAAFSHRPWVVDAAFDPIEDFLHSFTATAMGFAFALGVLVRLLQRERHGLCSRAFDITALVTATVIPILMVYLPTMDGLVQRLMFLTAYLWYGNEALLVRAPGRGAPNKPLESTR
ncbi:MAG: DUF998 domain-containing protein [Gammaproteobacteria bacterium]|nr:DUF998 domain-containing protein [Gammaproteobacteria bacterium]